MPAVYTYSQTVTQPSRARRTLNQICQETAPFTRWQAAIFRYVPLTDTYHSTTINCCTGVQSSQGQIYGE